MNTKLTLTIEQTVVDTAKKYAKFQERSLSNLIENYLIALTQEIPQNDIALTPTVKMLKGSFYAPKDFNYTEGLTEILTDKYIK
jgi:hypothetical protein